MKRIIKLAASCTLITTVFATSAQQFFPEDGVVPTQPALSEIPIDQEVIVPQPAAAAAEFEARSVDSGNWNQPWVWDCACIPGNDYDVIVSSGHEIALIASASAVSLTIEEGAVFSANEQEGVQLELLGDFNNNGEFIRGMSLISFNGEVDQQINGATDFYELSVSNQNQLTINNETGVFGRLFVNAATLVTNDLLTLKATGNQRVGAIAPLFDGVIVGNIIFERNVMSPYNGWLTIGAPISDATIAEINDDFVTTGFEGADYPAYSFVSIRTYNEAAETTAAAFSPIQSVDDAMVPGLGYYVYTNAGSYTYGVAGQVISGDFDFPVSFTDQGTPVQDGLNVVSNPYPSNINWDHEGAWVKDNMYSAIYIWDVSLNQFRTYVNGFGVNGGTPVIKAGEAFWVQAAGSNPTLSVNETAKVYNFDAPVNENGNFLKLRIDGLGLGDETIIAFDENASQSFDVGMDAFKFFSDNAVLNLATRTDDNIFLAVNNTSIADEAIAIPIILTSSQSGSATITLEEKPTFDDRCLYIEDTVSGLIYPLDETNTIEFLTDVVSQQARFYLHVTQPITANAVDVACTGAESGSVEVSGFGDGPWDYFWFDAEGNVINTEMQTNEAGELGGLPAGSYSVSVSGIEHCGTLSSEELVIGEPSAIAIEATTQALGCDETDTGSIELEVNGGAGEYSFLWNDGSSDEDRFGIAAGTYSVAVTDANGCESNLEVEVEAAQNVSASFEADQQVITLTDGEATVNFTNQSTNADTFVWNFGDGSMASNEENPTHTFTEAGNYIVNMEASNDECSGSYQIVVIVEEGVGVNDEAAFGQVDVYQANGYTAVRFNHNDLRSYRLEAYNMLGQTIMAPLEGYYGNQQVNIDLGYNVPAALISVINVDTSMRKTYKILR